MFFKHNLLPKATNLVVLCHKQQSMDHLMLEKKYKYVLNWRNSEGNLNLTKKLQKMFTNTGIILHLCIPY